MVIKIEDAPKIKHISIDITFDELDNQKNKNYSITSGTPDAQLDNQNNSNNQNINNKPEIPKENKEPKNGMIQEEF